ncbi:MAG: hypothetical protein ACTSRG_24300, partial [Candidatus Helarchaeota archaeon]
MPKSKKSSHFVNYNLAYQVQMLPSILIISLETFFKVKNEYPNEKFTYGELISSVIFESKKAHLAVKDSLHMGIALGFFEDVTKWNKDATVKLTPTGELIARTKISNPILANILFLKESLKKFKLLKGILKYLYIAYNNPSKNKIKLEELTNNISRDKILINPNKNFDLGTLNEGILRKTIDSWFKININPEKGEGGYFQIVEYEGRMPKFIYNLTDHGYNLLNKIWSEYILESIRNNYDFQKSQNLTEDIFELVGYDLGIPENKFYS